MTFTNWIQVFRGFQRLFTVINFAYPLTFILGDVGQVYYDDNDIFNAGLSDYAFILDFNAVEDLIQLAGSSMDYRLGASSTGASTNLWLQASQTEDELIAVLDQVQISSFDQGFSFV